jgi:hypothetical protein
MSATALARPEVMTADAHWRWDTRGRQPGATRVIRVGLEVTMRVADHLVQAVPGEPKLRSLLTARLQPDGSASVTTRCAPPALLLTDAGVRLLPADGGSTARAVLEPGDLLVLRSAAVLDTEPCGLVDLLKAGPSAARQMPLAQLVRNLLAGSLAGAAAVARYSG